jgi:RNA polymerase sigma factor (sigma-70 family)
MFHCLWSHVRIRQIPKKPRSKMSETSTHDGPARERVSGGDYDGGHGPEVDLVRLYLDEIGQRSLLDRDGEARLGAAIQAGLEARRALASGDVTSEATRDSLERAAKDGGRARQEFVEANLRLVVSVAKRYQRPGVELLDLVQAGNIGLLRAVERFDSGLGNKFSTYATWWIRQSIIRELGDVGRAIRLPVHLREQVVSLARARDRLRAELGHEPSLEEIAGDVGATTDRVRELLAVADDVVSLSLPVGDSDDRELSDLLADSGVVDPADKVAGSAEQHEVRALLDHLSEHQATVLRLRFGLDGGNPRSLEEVGRALGISRERVRQLEARALRRLRNEESARALRPAS